MPLASPLYADLTGLPPMLIQVGSDEILLSDAASFAERAQMAGVDAAMEVWQGMQHEWHFTANYVPEASNAIAGIGLFIKSRSGY
jgi:monoterpene epsilon-lactone hydrolase